MDIEDLAHENPDLIDQGDWVSEIPNMGDVKLKVLGLGSMQYRTAQEAKYRKVPSNLRDRNGTPNTDERMRITTELLYEVVLLDWSGMSNKGEPVKYSKDLAKLWCTTPRYRRFADAVVWASQQVDNGRSDSLQEAMGN